MVGADPILSPDQVGEWWNDGLRVVEPVHFGTNDYAHGTGSPGGLPGLNMSFNKTWVASTSN